MLDNDHSWHDQQQPCCCPQRRQSVAQSPIDHQYQGWVKVTVGHDLCRTKSYGGDLGQEEGDDRAEDGQVNDPAPDDQFDIGPVNRCQAVAA